MSTGRRTGGFEPKKATRGVIDRHTALAIFEAEGTTALIASRFRVSRNMVYDIKAGRAWGYATGVDGRRPRTGSAGRYDDPVFGVVILYSGSGGKVVERAYRGADHRKTVLRDLRASLGAERFDRLAVHIRPGLKDTSLERVDLEHPDHTTFGLRAQKRERVAEKYPEEEALAALKEKLGLDGEKCHSACETAAEMPAIARETAPAARGTFFSTQPPQGVAMSEIDAKIDSLEKVA